MLMAIFRQQTFGVQRRICRTRCLEQPHAQSGRADHVKGEVVNIREKIKRYRQAAEKAAVYTVKFQQPDGGYIWKGYVPNAYHKQVYAWPIAGRFAEAQRLLDWAQRNTVLPDGQLKEYGGDLYKLTWFVHGAQRLGRVDLSFPLMASLISCQAPCGGFPRYMRDDFIRSVSTSWMGITALAFGRTDVAEKAAQCCISMLEQQRDAGKFFCHMTRDGKLITDAENPKLPFVDMSKPKQNYYEMAIPMWLCCRLYQISGKASYLGYATRFFETVLRCHEDKYRFTFSGKTAYAGAVYYMITGDERGKEAAVEFCDFLVETQLPEGGWRDTVKDPDELLYYVDHAAEFIVWLLEISAMLESKAALDTAAK